MNTLEKEFVPYEMALALKELGFDNHKFITFIFVTPENIYYTPNSYVPNSAIWTPLYQQAFSWFREKYNLEVSFMFYEDYLKDGDKNVYEVNIQNRVSYELHLITPLNGFKTHPEAELECLKKLIEIVKEKK